MKIRRAGVLLHPTSLPSSEGVGTLGKEAYRFIDFLAAAGFSLWQILPLTPPGCGNSPYSSYSAFAGNPLLIDLETIVNDGDLLESQLFEAEPSLKADFDEAAKKKMALLKKGAASFFKREPDERKKDFWHFCDTTFWLHDYALFSALKKHFDGKPWSRWKADIKMRDNAAVEHYSNLCGEEIGVQKYIQWQFARQWGALHEYAGKNGVSIIGDAPIYVAYDSADVWCNRHIFLLDKNCEPELIAGVPPDYFSKNGQLWGNPLYRWERLKDEDYSWWRGRIRHDLTMFDYLRIDHFRGFSACWGVSPGKKNAMHGEWIKSEGFDLFNRMRKERDHLPIIAEDLGVITDDVAFLRDHFNFPGMKILQFAFDSDGENPYLPHNHNPGSIVYTGTHDNDTTCGWVSSLSWEQKRAITDYTGCQPDEIFKTIIRLALSSVSLFAIIPMQDILKLGSEARMNTPGEPSGNWGWRMSKDYTDKIDLSELSHLLKIYGRR